MKMPGKCTGPKYVSTNLEKWGMRHLGGHEENSDEVLEDEENSSWVPAKEARNWRIEGQKRRITRKEY